MAMAPNLCSWFDYSNASAKVPNFNRTCNGAIFCLGNRVGVIFAVDRLGQPLDMTAFVQLVEPIQRHSTAPNSLYLRAKGANYQFQKELMLGSNRADSAEQQKTALLS